MVRRGFTDADTLLGDLLDRFEASPGASRLFAGVAEPADFGSAAAVDDFAIRLKDLEALGGVEIRYRGKGRFRTGAIGKVRLADASIVYQALGRKPLVDQVAAGFRDLGPIPESMEPQVAIVRDRWSRGRRYFTLAVNDIDALRKCVALAHALSRDGDCTTDMRTFSRRTCRDSKALENHLTTVISLLPKDFHDSLPLGVLKAHEIIAHLGISKFPQPILASGPLIVDDNDVSAWPYMGIPSNSWRTISASVPVRTILTIENLATFHRQVLEVPQKDVVVVYVGGWPSPQLVIFLRTLTTHFPQAQFRHWGDIDLEGALIADLLWRNVTPMLTLHMMDPDDATRRGEAARSVPYNSAKAMVSIKSPAHTVIKYLMSENAHTLEQEELDPRPV